MSLKMETDVKRQYTMTVCGNCHGNQFRKGRRKVLKWTLSSWRGLLTGQGRGPRIIAEVMVCVDCGWYTFSAAQSERYWWTTKKACESEG
jgi:hypothetical protein